MCCQSAQEQQTTEREIEKTIPFIVTTKRIIYLGINLIKEV